MFRDQLMADMTALQNTAQQYLPMTLNHLLAQQI